MQDTQAQGGQPEEHDEDWGTRAEIALLACKNEKTVKRWADEHRLDARTGARGVVQHRYADFVRIGFLRQEQLPGGLTGSQAAEVVRLQRRLDQLLADKGELAGRLAEAVLSRDLVVEQLAAKDEQLRAQGKTIERLVATLTRAAA